MKKYLLLIILVVGCLSFISAVECGDNSLGSFKRGESIELRQTCDDCTFVNLSSVTYPNSTNIYFNEFMTQNGIDFNYTFSSAVVKGDYFYVVSGDKDGGFSSETFCFEVTETGNKLDNPQSLLVIGLIIILIFLTITFLYFGNKTEYLPFKIFLTSLGVLFIMLTVGVSLNAVKQLMIMGDVFSGIFVNLYRLMLILVSGGGIGLILYIIVQSLKQFYKHRGMTDDDDDD